VREEVADAQVLETGVSCVSRVTSMSPRGGA
jgi:hypothetical protein